MTRFTATFVDRFVPSTFHMQKRALREHLGLLRPVRCPGCRMFTKQKRVMTDIRQCLSCLREFTIGAARKRGQRDGARWAHR